MAKIIKNGFTIVEMAVVIVIISILITGYFAFTINRTIDDTIKSNDQQLKSIDTAITEYYKKNGFIPCPASRIDAPSSASFGTSTDCTASPGGISDVGAGADIVRIGVVPVRQLNLPDNYMFDVWGNRITYAIVKALGTTAVNFMDNTSGIAPISILDAAGNSVVANIAQPNHIAYVIVSSGPNNKGAYNYNGTQAVSCSGSTLDDENCNNDAIFRYATYTPNSYDDYVRWKTRQQLKYEGYIANNKIGVGASNYGKFALIHHSSPGNVGIASTGWQQRILNTISTSTLTRASLASNQVTLGAGTYYIKATAVGCKIGSHMTRVTIAGGGATIAVGQAAFADTSTAAGDCTPSEAIGIYTFTYPTAIQVETYVSVTNAVNGFSRNPLSLLPTAPYSPVILEIWEL